MTAVILPFTPRNGLGEASHPRPTRNLAASKQEGHLIVLINYTPSQRRVYDALEFATFVPVAKRRIVQLTRTIGQA